MTNEEKRICAERLFDEIGMIDDRFIAEAATPYARQTRIRNLRRILVAAVSLSLAVSLAVGIFVVGKIGNKSDGMAGDNAAPNGAGTVEKEEGDKTSSQTATLSSRLDELRVQTEALKINAEDLDLFSETPSVVWKYSDENEYRVRAISASQAKTLSQKLSVGDGKTVYAQEDDPSCDLEGVWITLGDGRVISPYVEQTAGNVGYGELFEYEPEYEPSEEFSEYLCDMIS